MSIASTRLETSDDATAPTSLTQESESSGGVDVIESGGEGDADGKAVGGDTQSQAIQRSIEAVCSEMSGTWKLVKTRGEIQQFLRDQGYSYLFSQMGAAFLRAGFSKREEVDVTHQSFKCTETGAPMKKSFSQTYRLRLTTIISNNKEKMKYDRESKQHKIQVLDPNGSTIMISAAWLADDLSKPTLVFETYEKYPKIVQRYVEKDSGRMVAIVRCVNKEGNPMLGSLIQEYERMSS
ncbi:hypothetical protein AAMO2058_001672400 [Amorphochlora amoebiformis]